MSQNTLTCIVCGYVDNEELGDEEQGLAPGTRWQDGPDYWECPECDEEQHEDTVPMDWAEGLNDLTCQSCGANFTLGDVSHCYR